MLPTPPAIPGPWGSSIQKDGGRPGMSVMLFISKLLLTDPESGFWFFGFVFLLGFCTSDFLKKTNKTHIRARAHIHTQNWFWFDIEPNLNVENPGVSVR